jgi:hypothetical protein
MLNTNHRPFDIPDQVHLSEDQLDRLHVIEDYDLWFVVERVGAKDVLSPQRTDEAVAEFRKYMALAALGHMELGMHSSDVDEIWHNFILFTREYAEFCHRICGHMIHHRPNTSRRPELPSSSVSEFQMAYRTYFGSLPSIWCARPAEILPGDCDVSQGGPPAMRRLHGECDDAQEPPEVILPGDCDVGQDPPGVSRLHRECDAANAEPISECDSQGESTCQSECGATTASVATRASSWM